MTSRKSHSASSEWMVRPGSSVRADKEIAAHYITERFPVVAETMTIGEVHTYIAEFAHEFRAMDYIYVVNPTEKLVGVLSMRDLFLHPKKVQVKSVMQRDIITISLETRREKIARIAMEYNLRSIPVIQNKKLVGVVQTHKVLHTINRVLRENLLTFSGVHHSHLEYDNTLQIPIQKSLMHRLPWLIVGLIGVIIAAGIIHHFEDILNEHLIIAFFIPAILYMSNALGIQNQTLLIRDLALMGKELKLGPYFTKTILIGITMSAIIGVLVYGIISLLWSDPATAFVIALAMSMTLIISSIMSLTITMIFKNAGQDPALGSGPFATVISDLSSIVVYFVMVSVLL